MNIERIVGFVVIGAIAIAVVLSTKDLFWTSVITLVGFAAVYEFTKEDD